MVTGIDSFREWFKGSEEQYRCSRVCTADAKRKC